MKPLRSLLIGLVSLAGALMLSSEPAFSKTQVRALWVECEGTNETLSSKEKIRALVETAAQNHFNLLYVQIFRGNQAWYRSQLLPNQPYQNFLKKEKIDLLQFLIDEAHKRNIEVHAWVNQMRVVRNPQKSYPILDKLGRDAITRNGKGVSLLDFPQDKLPDGGYWLDPGDLKVQRFLADVAEEVVRNYPKLDGYHLDFIRIPFDAPYAGSMWDGGKGFGYGKKSVERFRAKTGIDPMKMERTRANAQKWDDWRREQISDVVRTVAKRVKSVNAKMEVTAAAMCWPDRAYLSSFQDWGQWLEEGSVDAVISMNYSIDSRFVNRLSRQALALKRGSQVYIGLGSYLLEEQLKDFSRQIEETLALNPDGIAFFSYDSMLKKPEMFQIAKQQFETKKSKRISLLPQN